MIRRLLIGTVIVIFVILLGAFIHAAVQEKPFKWMETYHSYDRNPYGGYVIFNQLPKFFPGNKVKRLGKNDLSPYYSHLKMDFSTKVDDERDSTLHLELLDQDFNNQFNLFGLSKEFYLDDVNARAFLMHLYQGNHALISAFHFGGILPTLTGIETEIQNGIPPDDEAGKFSIKIYDHKAVKVKPFTNLTTILSFPDSAEVIATNLAGEVLGIRLPVGEGSVTFFTFPPIFSNYYILKDNTSLSSSLLGALPNKPTFWTNKFVGGYNVQESRSLLSFIHSEPSLTWAFYTLLLAVLIYLVFQIKREQRAIPVIKAQKNVSLKFTETITNLYLMKRDNKDLLQKKMIFFLEQVRSRYHMDVNTNDANFYKRLAVKTNVSEDLVKYLFHIYKKLTAKKEVSKEEFLTFNRLLQNFKLEKHERTK